MFLKTWLPLLLVCLALPPLAAQQTEADYLLEISRPPEPDRYHEVRGTPYRYPTFRPARLYDATMNEYRLDSVNYNGFSSQFEYYVDGQLRELAGASILRVNISDDDGTEHTYGYRINPRYRDKYAELLFMGDFVTATLIYDVINDEKIVQDVGKTVKLRRFTPKSLYYALVDGELVPLKLNAKSLAADLGHKAAITKFIKAEKLKPSRRDDLLRILAYAEELYY